jgi:hypothetical protein
MWKTNAEHVLGRGVSAMGRFRSAAPARGNVTLADLRQPTRRQCFATQLSSVLTDQRFNHPPLYALSIPTKSRRLLRVRGGRTGTKQLGTYKS